MDTLYDKSHIAEAHHSPHKRELTPHALKQSFSNPLCGDEFVLYLAPADAGVFNGSYLGRCCLVCQRSADLLFTAMNGRPLPIVAAALPWFMRQQPMPEMPEEVNQPMRAFWEQLARYPTRHRCANFPWQSLQEALGKEAAAPGSVSGCDL